MVRTYPVLWSHDAEEKERSVLMATCKLRRNPTKDQDEREAVDLKAAAVWAFQLHIATSIRIFNSTANLLRCNSRPAERLAVVHGLDLLPRRSGKGSRVVGQHFIGSAGAWWIANSSSRQGNITSETYWNIFRYGT